MPETVTSPGGDLVTIYPDDEWLAMTGGEEAGLRQLSGKVPAFGALWLNGPFVDANGRATAPWHEAAQRLGYKGSPQALNGVIARELGAPAIEQRVNGKRRYAIRLVALPQRWHKAIVATYATSQNGDHAPHDEEPPADTPAAGTELPPPPPPPPVEVTTADVADDDDMPPMPPPDEPFIDMPASIDLQVSASVAMALLTQVIEIVSTGTAPNTDVRIRALEADYHDMSDKLSRRLEENQKLRKSIRELGDEINTTRAERDGLRRRLRIAESNLEKATSVDVTRIVNERVQAELAKIMQAKPSARAEGDED